MKHKWINLNKLIQQRSFTELRELKPKQIMREDDHTATYSNQYLTLLSIHIIERLLGYLNSQNSRCSENRHLIPL